MSAREPVKPGYKQTEVGVIPEDWEVSSIGQVYSVSAGGDFDPLQSSDFRDEAHPYPIYSNALTIAGLYGFCSYCDHRAGSITVMARGMLGSANFRDQAFTAIGRVIVLEPRIKQDGRFFSVFLNERIQFAVESTGVPQLTAPHIAKYQLPVPPLPEQRAIAAALSDVDALIASLDALIAKKRDMKQAAMQQLLTGKTRLPGFDTKAPLIETKIGLAPRDWRVITLRQACIKIQDGTHFSPKPGGNEFLYITSKNIASGALDLAQTEQISATEHAKIFSRCDVKKGDLLLTKDGASTGNAALNIIDETFSLLSSVAFLRFDTLPTTRAFSYIKFSPIRDSSE
jgi:restriction endonuclease S subunit